MKRYLWFSIIIVIIITFIVWIISAFIQPILPASINNILILLPLTLSGVAIFLAQLKNITEFFHSLSDGSDKKAKNSLIQSVRERTKFLHEINESSDADQLEEDVNDLIEFVEKLQQGNYYAKKIKKIDPSFTESFF